MFGLGIRYLMGWAMAAADGAGKQRAEWPPHPDRVFMALAAAWFETGRDSGEGKVLEWLEEQGPPKLATSLEMTHLRSVVSHYVPVNDSGMARAKTIEDKLRNGKDGLKGLKEVGLSLLPEFRARQPRSFPVAIPRDPVVHLVWEQPLLEAHRPALASLCSKVTSIGHSASLVQMWVTDAPPQANLVPVSGTAEYRLRIFGPGRLAFLEGRCNRDRCIAYAELEVLCNNAKGKLKATLKQRLDEEFPDGKPASLRPEPGLWQGYSSRRTEPEAKVPGSVFDPRFVVLSFVSGKRLPLPATLKVTQALRGAVLKACPEPIPEWVSGHDERGQPSRDPHVAFLPLPFVGREHADGRLMGVALAVPRAISPEETARVLVPWLYDDQGFPLGIKLFDGEWLECMVELETREKPPYSLNAETWTGPAVRWASVTPVVLDRHFDGPTKWERAAESVKESCERIGLPRPVEVLLHPVSMVQGVPRSNEFPWISRKRDGGRMHHAHALIVFPEPVQGPVIIGAGRFRGYGLCRPLYQGGDGNG